MSWHNLHRDLQDDVKGRLENHDFFSDVPVLLQRAGNIDNEVERALNCLNEKTGKMGACLIVLMPETEAPEENLPGPPIEIVISVQVYELTLVNEDTANGGTGKDAESLANVVLNLLHLYAPYHLGNVLVADRKPIRPVKIEGAVSYLVMLRLRTGLENPQKVATPTLTEEDGLYTLTCATAGATIYYTIDGSHPGPVNEEAIEYTAPFAEPATGTLVRWVAYKSGFVPSDSGAAEVND